jgi:ABC-type molybdate transport system ATPase subunit
MQLPHVDECALQMEGKLIGRGLAFRMRRVLARDVELHGNPPTQLSIRRRTRMQVAAYNRQQTTHNA